LLKLDRGLGVHDYMVSKVVLPNKEVKSVTKNGHGQGQIQLMQNYGKQ